VVAYTKNPFSKGDTVVMTTFDHTVNRFGGDPEHCNACVGKLWVIERSRDNHVMLIGDNHDYTWHYLDFEFAKNKARIKVAIKAPAKVVKAPAIPTWVKPHDKKHLQKGGAFIEFVLYRPKRGEVRKPLSYDELVERSKRQNKKIDRYTDVLHKTAEKPYDTWENTNRSCFASLNYLGQKFVSPSYWNNKPPTWICLKLSYGNELGGLTRLDVFNWITILKQYRCLPPEVNVFEMPEQGTIRFKLGKLSPTELFLRLCLIRNMHEQKWIVVHTLYLMSHGINFWIAYIMAHRTGYFDVNNHSAISCRYSTGGIYPYEIANAANRLEQFVLKGGEEKPFRNSKAAFSFKIHDTLDNYPLDFVHYDNEMSYEDLKVMQPMENPLKLSWR